MQRMIDRSVFDSDAHVIVALTCVGTSTDLEKHHLVNHNLLYYAQAAYSEMSRVKQRVPLASQHGLCKMTNSTITYNNTGRKRQAWIASCFSNEYQKVGNTQWQSRFNQAWLKQSLTSLRQWIDATGYPLRIAFQYMDGCVSKEEWKQVLLIIEECFASHDVLVCKGLILLPHVHG